MLADERPLDSIYKNPGGTPYISSQTNLPQVSLGTPRGSSHSILQIRVPPVLWWSPSGVSPLYLASSPAQVFLGAPPRELLLSSQTRPPLINVAAAPNLGSLSSSASHWTLDEVTAIPWWGMMPSSSGSLWSLWDGRAAESFEAKQGSIHFSPLLEGSQAGLAVPVGYMVFVDSSFYFY